MLSTSQHIWRSLPAQNGHEPCVERADRLGASPTPNVRGLDTVYCITPNTRVCCVLGSDQMLSV